jgi:fibronectin type 3 domain-containing protein
MVLMGTKNKPKSEPNSINKLSKPAIIVAVSLIVIMMLTLFSPILGTSNNPCTGPGCHGSSHWEYTNLLPSDSLSNLPTIFQVDTSAEVKMAVEVTGADSVKEYKIQTLRVTLSSLNSKVNIKNTTQQVSNKWPGNKITFQWTVTGSESGADTLIFDLWAYNDHDGNISWASTFTDSYQYDITVQGKPESPQNVGTRAGDGFVVLSWNTPSFDGGLPITKYNIYKGTDSGGETFETSVGESIREYNDTSVVNGQKYYYYLTAENTFGESSPSIEVFATPKSSKTVPNSPKLLQAIPGKDNIQLNWEAPTYDGGSSVIEYKIYKGTNSGSESYQKSVNFDKLSYKDTSVTSGTTYYYFITAVNTIGESDPSSEMSATPDNELPSITITSPPDNTYVNSDSLSVEWTGSDGISGIDHFEIKLDNNNWVDIGMGTIYTLLSLVEGAHEIHVKAVDKIGNTNQASVTVIVDLHAPALIINTPKNGSFINSSSVLIEWECSDDTSDIDHYEIRINNGFWKKLGQVCTYTYKSLPDGIHTVQVKAMDITQNTIIAQVSFTIDATKPKIDYYSPSGNKVSLDSGVHVTFSEEMDRSTVIIFVDGIVGKAIWNNDNVTFEPNNLLDYNTEYNVSVTGSDLLGNPLDKFSWSFTTKKMERIKGQILDENKNPISNAAIFKGLEEITRTDSNGNFVVEILPGKYTIIITKEGYKNKTMEITIKDGEVENLGEIILIEKQNQPEDPMLEPDNKGSSEFPWILVIIMIIVIVIIIIGVIFNKLRQSK